MKKYLIALLALGSFSVFANPINILGCQSDTKFVHIRILSEDILDVTITTGSAEIGSESNISYSAELTEDEKMMVAGGSWVITVDGPEGKSLTLSIAQNRDGQVIGDGYPEFLNCHKLSNDEVFGY